MSLAANACSCNSSFVNGLVFANHLFYVRYFGLEVLSCGRKGIILKLKFINRLIECYFRYFLFNLILNNFKSFLDLSSILDTKILSFFSIRF